MAYQVFLGRMLLPVTPGKIETKITDQNATINLIDGSSINLLKLPGLREVSFKCQLPYIERPYAHYKDGFLGPEKFIVYFRELKRLKQYFQFVISRSMPNGNPLPQTNIKMAIDDFWIVEDAGEGADVVLEIRLKEYKVYGTKKAKIVNDDAIEDPKAKRDTGADPPVTIGCNVIVNGVLHYDSYGNGPGQTRTNWRGVIGNINKDGSHPYHVNTPDGLWQGWVLASAVKVVT